MGMLGGETRRSRSSLLPKDGAVSPDKMGEEAERLERLQARIEKDLRSYEAANAVLSKDRGDLAKADEEFDMYTTILARMRALAQEVESNAHKRVATLVSRCLAEVFTDDAYELQVAFVEKRGKTEAELRFHRNGVEVDPLSASGGGVVDVAAFALRIVALALTTPPLRRTIVLDEPFRFVSREYRSTVRDLVQTLAEELDIQFIIVTHDPKLMIGNVIEL